MAQAHTSFCRRPAAFVSLALLLAQVCCAGTGTNADPSRAAAQREAPQAQTTAQPQPSAGSPQTTAQPSAATGAAGGDTASVAPDELVRQFYDWYLGELRAGHEPHKQEKLKQFVTDDYVREHANGPADFDPVLMLPKPESDWFNMRVEAGKPKHYEGEQYYDAYVEVTYKNSADAKEPARNGARHAPSGDVWTVGLKHTTAGWRIASLGINE